jgi:hypothetical protein
VTRFSAPTVSKAVFSAIDSLAWGRIMRWLRRKYKRGRNRIGMPELRRRFCDKGWRFAWNGVAFTGASSVTVSRYRYRGKPDSHAVDLQTVSRPHGRLTSGQGTRSARCGESRTPGAGRRPRETGRW